MAFPLKKFARKTFDQKTFACYYICLEIQMPGRHLPASIFTRMAFARKIFVRMRENLFRANVIRANVFWANIFSKNLSKFMENVLSEVTGG
jgi:hypothetical protein